jgi:hypothetical protein
VKEEAKMDKKTKGEFMNEHTVKVGGKDYTLVAARIVAFRNDHPDWTISTEVRKVDEKNYIYATVAAPIVDTAGNRTATAVISTAHKEVGKASGGAAKWPLESAETGAIGRALGLCGYGTLCGDFDEGDQLADAPVARKESNAATSIVQFPGLAQEDASSAGDDSDVRDDTPNDDPAPQAPIDYPTDPAELIKKINYCRKLDTLESMRLHVREVAKALSPGSDERRAVVEAFQSKQERLEQKNG